MRIHHLNCGCMCPIGGRAFDGVSRGLRATLVCHCLLIETDRGLVLVDTGFGVQDVERPVPRLSAFFLALNNIQLERRDTALAAVTRLGYAARDVRHIVLTHLDFDHAGGLEDFPEAVVHVMQAEHEAARARRGFLGRRRYRPEQWDGVRQWRHYAAGGERWFGFNRVRDLDGLPPEILMIPLPGHTRGHAGVAVLTPEGWLLHAGDAYFHRHEMAPVERRTPGLAAYQALMDVDGEAKAANRDRLRRLALDRRTGVRIFCSHDPIELDALQMLAELAATRQDGPMRNADADPVPA